MAAVSLLTGEWRKLFSLKSTVHDFPGSNHHTDRLSCKTNESFQRFHPSHLSSKVSAGGGLYVWLNSISGLRVSALMWWTSLTFHFGVLQLIGKCTTLPHQPGANDEVQNVFMFTCTPSTAVGLDKVKLECDAEANPNLVPLTDIYMSRLKSQFSREHRVWNAGSHVTNTVQRDILW